MSWIKDERTRMREHVYGGRVLCLTGKKKKRGIEGSGSFTRVGRETSLRESFRNSKRGVGVISLSPVQGLVPQAKSSPDLPSCTHQWWEQGEVQPSAGDAVLIACFDIWEKFFLSLPQWLRRGDIFPCISQDRSAVGCPGQSSSSSWSFHSEGSVGSLVRHQGVWAQEVPALWITVVCWYNIAEESAALPVESGIITGIALWVRNWPEERHDQVLLKSQVLG